MVKIIRNVNLHVAKKTADKVNLLIDCGYSQTQAELVEKMTDQYIDNLDKSDKEKLHQIMKLKSEINNK